MPSGTQGSLQGNGVQMSSFSNQGIDHDDTSNTIARLLYLMIIIAEKELLCCYD